jgi:hypothetical protein
MKTPASSQSAPLRLAWIACAGLALSACTGPGLEPPGSGGDNTAVHGPEPNRDAGIAHQGGSGTGNTGNAGTGGRSSTDDGSTSSGGSGGTTGGNGGSAGEHNPPVITQDAGAPPPDADDEDAG